MHFILVRLWFGDFSKSLAKIFFEIITELLAQSAKFINNEEVKAIKKQVDWSSKQAKCCFEKGNGKENRLPKLQFQNYTLLNTPLYKILDDVKVVELLNLLERKNLIVKLPSVKKYHKYHNNWTHNNKKYVTLKNEIKDLIHRGHLR